MIVYSDEYYEPDNMRFKISGISLIMAMFQLLYTFIIFHIIRRYFVGPLC